jgi:DHA3 family macrolide efflux protein-like MFS transporter
MKDTRSSMRSFFIIWAGEAISLLGSSLSGFALAVWIFQQSSKATPVVLTVLAGALPRILLSPVAGSLSDRWDRRRLMIWGDAGSALVTLIILLFSAAGWLALWNIILLIFIQSACSVFQGNAFNASIPMLVPKNQLTRANGMIQSSDSIAFLVAPLLAGMLYLVVGLNGILLIDFITFFFAIGALLLVNIPQPQTASEPEQSVNGLRQAAVRVWGDFRLGWNFISSRGGLFTLLLYFALVNFLLNMSSVLSGPMVLSRYDPAVLGLVQMVMGVGLLAGSVMVSVLGSAKQRARSIILYLMAASAGLVIAGVGPQAFFPAAGFFVLLFCIPPANANSQAIFQAKTPANILGRVYSVRTVLSSSMLPLAYLLAGPLSDLVFEPWMRAGGPLSASFLNIIGTGPGRGIGLMFILAGLLLFLVSLTAFANPRLRHIESELPDIQEEETMK